MEILAIVQPVMLLALSMRNTNFPGDGVGRLDIDAMFKIESVQDADTEKKFLRSPGSKPTLNYKNFILV